MSTVETGRPGTPRFDVLVTVGDSSSLLASTRSVDRSSGAAAFTTKGNHCHVDTHTEPRALKGRL
jgi:hypothetical protein